MIDLVPWLCWIFPTAGTVASLALARFGKIRDWTVVLLSFLGLLMALFLIPQLFSYSYTDMQVFWFVLPGGINFSIGLLIDPLSIILAVVVAFLGSLIMLYSVKSMAGDPGLSRYWFFMSLFIGSMLLLVLSDNFILMFIGWKIVGLCSYGLIGYYYSDEKEHWVGGPLPFPFQKPSRAGLKGLLVTTFGDMALLAGIIILYLYAGTFNFMQLYQTAGVWLAQMAKDPGILTLTAVLILAGPLAKSAQFPFHEWLPDAMTGPVPVSALIHAATMVKAGVYLVARLLPIFFFAAWVAVPKYPEALSFFIVTAVIGAFTIILSASQAMVSPEVKKVLAYSTMGTIGYMMLALGVAGLSSSALVTGLSASIFELINHGIFKVVLFLCAGVVIYAAGSIYLSDMRLSRTKMYFTWACMWIAVLALVGVPPFSGFWSKDDILVVCWQSGQYALFAVAFAGVILTAFYAFRFMGLIFYGNKNGAVEGREGAEGTGVQKREASWLMLAPYGILAALTVAIGLVGPLVTSALQTVFSNYFADSLKLVPTGGGSSSLIFGIPSVEIAVAAGSLVMIAMGAVPAYWLYISHKADPEGIISRHPALQRVYGFLRNRWYIDAFYNKVFVGGSLYLTVLAVRFVENPLDRLFNGGVPALFRAANKGFRRVQTGILSVNMLLFMAFLAALLIALWISGLI